MSLLTSNLYAFELICSKQSSTSTTPTLNLPQAPDQREHRVIHEAEWLLHQHGLWKRGWRFEFDRAKKRAGKCSFNRKIITLSKAFALKAPDAEVLDTLLHEMAHALVGAQHGHDAVWRAKALSIGCNAKTYHSVKFSDAPFIKACINGCWAEPVFRRNRRIHSYQCRYCHGKVVYAPTTAMHEGLNRQRT
ncbi:SprT-like domain-containing protein [Deltaproteobacteria bacterium TL4]